MRNFFQNLAGRARKEGGETSVRRRNVLKLFVFGGGAFVLGKIFGPSVGLFDSGEEYNFKNFRVVENGKELGFYDRLGNEILILEKDPDAGK